MTTLDRHLVRETARLVLVGVLGFVGLVLARKGAAVVEIALARDVGARTTLLLLALALPGALAYAIPMASLFATAATFARMRADREAVAAFAAGISPARLARPLAPLAAGVAAASAVVSGVWEPTATDAVESGRWIRAVDPIAALPEGGVGRIGAWTFWAGRIDARRRTLERLLVSTVEENRRIALIAPRARWRLEGSEVRIEVEGGSILERDARDDDGRTHLLRFETREMTIPIGEAAEGGRYARRAPLGSVLARLDEPPFAFELQRRLAAPLACLAFVALGPALGLGTRGGRTAALAASAAVFIGHYLAAAFLEAAIAAGTIPAAAYQAPSVLVAAAGGALLARAGRPA